MSNNHTFYYSSEQIKSNHMHTHKKAKLMDSSRKHPSLISSTSRPRICLCSPTNHPGSFRCARHRASYPKLGRKMISEQLNHRKKTNLVKEFLMKIIKPSSLDIQRRRNFEPKPTRFFVLNHSNNEMVCSWWICSFF